MSDLLFPDPTSSREIRQWEPDEWERISLVRDAIQLVAERSQNSRLVELAALLPTIPMYPFAYGRTLLFPNGKTLSSLPNIYFHADGSLVHQMCQNLSIPLNSIPLSEGRWHWTTHGWRRELGLYYDTEKLILLDSDFACRPIDGPQCIVHELAHAKHGLDERMPFLCQIEFLEAMLEQYDPKYHSAISRTLSQTKLLFEELPK